MYDQSQQKYYFEKSKDFLKGSVSKADYELLIEILNFHEWKYYVDNNPLISDSEYDKLYNKLIALEESSEIDIKANSPSQRVSSDLSNQFASVKHYSPMLSLANSYDLNDLIDFDAQLKRILIGVDDDIQYIVEPKFDGGSIALVYENDILVRAATRGDGVEGDDITANARTISSVPLKAEFSKFGIFRAELRGEAVMAKEIFKQKNEIRALEGLDLFANPRNAATGGLRMKDPLDTKERGLDVFIFQLAYAVDKDNNEKLSQFVSHDKAMTSLIELGFKLPYKQMPQPGNINSAFDICNNWELERDNFEYELDGAVVKLNDFALQERSGTTQHHPRWAIAFKFKAKQATSRLLKVEYQIGKTGAITPVAKVEPVQLAGVTVSSISLHNEDFIKQKDIKIGDTLLIERAGDVIPYVVKSLAELRSGNEKEINFPQQCPFCHSDLDKSDDQAAWRCINPKCEEQNLQKMIFHVSKEAMNIEGFGKSIVEKFYDLGWIKDISDIYKLDYEKISELDGFGIKSAQNLSDAVSKAKTNSLARLLGSLSIHHLGKKASKLIAQEIQDVLDLKHWSEENFTNIKDIGPVVAKNVIAYFSEDENIAMIERLKMYGVNTIQTEEDKPLVVSDDAVFKNKTILFTGTLQSMSRKEAQLMAERKGAKNISAVSSNLDILVVGEKAGSKLKKAEQIPGITIITEEEFKQLINDV